MTDAMQSNDRLDRLLDDHRSLLVKVADLRDYVDQVSERGIPQYAELGARMEPLREELAKHFAMEECGGYLAEILEAAPDRTQEAEHLQAQHAAILEQLGSLAARLRDCDPPLDSWQQACDLFHELLDELRRHESQETALVQSVTDKTDTA